MSTHHDHTPYADCPVCAIEFPFLDEVMHADLLCMPEWSARDLAEFVSSVGIWVEAGIDEPAMLDPRRLPEWVELHFGAEPVDESPVRWMLDCADALAVLVRGRHLAPGAL